MNKHMLAATTALTLFALSPAAQAQDQAPDIDPAERAKIETVIQDYILKNPEIVMLAIGELQRRQMVARMLPAANLYRDYLEHDAESPVLGNPNGDITVVEFFDYRCGFCKRHYPQVMKLLADDGNIRFVPRQFPILDHPDAPPISMMASRAALAAFKQGKFAELHNALMTYPGSLTEEAIFGTAAKIGLDVAQLKIDMASKLVDKKIQNDLAIGKDIGFDGTPGYIIGNEFVLGAEGYDRLKEAVARARAAAKAASTTK